MAAHDPKLISGNANRPLAEAIARRMSMHRGVQMGLVDARVERFNDQEIFVEVYENVRGEDMFVIQSTSKPANDNLMELLIMADALRRSSASRITAVIPYFGYARQDRRTKARTPITAKLAANMMTSGGIERILTMDLHAAQIQGFFDMPVDNLYASPIFALDILHHFGGDMSDVMVVSPDVGGVARARELATRIGAPSGPPPTWLSNGPSTMMAGGCCTRPVRRSAAALRNSWQRMPKLLKASRRRVAARAGRSTVRLPVNPRSGMTRRV